MSENLFGEIEATPPELTPEKSGNLAERFGVPPFSILDARQGYWQARKKAWLALGIKSEIGRGGRPHGKDDRPIGPAGETPVAEYSGGDCWRGGSKVKPGGAPIPGRGRKGALDVSKQALEASGGWDDNPAHKSSLGRCYGQDLMRGEHTVGENDKPKFAGGLCDGLHALREAQKAGTELPDYQGQEQSGTSIFDPVLCELVYGWFCPPGGAILDPFAGGSVRGIVAARMGRRYLGIDLRPEQIVANETQAKTICAGGEMPLWRIGDSRSLPADLECPDLIFSCPPYGDLEVYSDDPRDLSTMPHHKFLAAYREIIAGCVSRLCFNRFAVFVVGDYRDQTGAGCYRNFVAETTAAFAAAGARLYNEAILITVAGSLPLRVGKQFESSRKLGKTHQNVMVYVKGDPAKAAAAIGAYKGGAA